MLVFGHARGVWLRDYINKYSIKDEFVLTKSKQFLEFALYGATSGRASS